MTRTLTGTSLIIGAYYGVEAKPLDESLEEQINKALAEEREKIKPSREDIDAFSWVTGDNNPIHGLEKRARKLGFEYTPLMGAHVAAYGEQYIERVVQHMRDYWGADIKIIGQDNKFMSPLYPGEKTLWQALKPKEVENRIEFSVTGDVKDKRIVGITSHLGRKYFDMPQLAGPIFSQKYLLDEDHLEEFYNSVGGKNNGKVPNMFPAAFVPATLLKLLEQKTQTLEGINRSMNFRFVSEAQPGKLQVDIFPPEEPKEIRGDYKYEFEAVVSQNKRPIAYGRMVSLTKQKIDFSI